MGIVFKKDESSYHYDGGNPPSHEELQRIKDELERENIKLKTSTNHEQIIWDLSSQLGEAKHKIKMLQWKIDEMKKILED